MLTGTDYSEEVSLEHLNVQRDISNILFELQADLLKATRSALQPQNHAAARVSSECMERAIQTCVSNAVEKWAPVVSVDLVPPKPISSLNPDPPKATSQTPQSLVVLPHPAPPVDAVLPTERISPSKPRRVHSNEWEKHREVIKKLYVEQGHPLDVVMKEMKLKYKFNAS
jgi:hypothetical protein